MKSSYLTNLVLLVVVAVLLWLSLRDTDDDVAPSGLSSLQPQQVSSIVINNHERQIKLSRQQHGWQLDQPFPARANDTRIRLLLSLLSTPIHGQMQPMTADALNQFGLKEPALTLQLNQHRFGFGQTEPLSGHRYVLHDNSVFLIDDEVTPLLKAGAAGFVDNRLIAAAARIQRLRLPLLRGGQADFSEHADISLVDGRWHSNLDWLGADALQTLVDNWTHASALQVRHLSPQALARLPQDSIHIWLQDSDEPLILLLGSSEQNLLLTDSHSGLQYILPRAVLTQLLPAAETP